MGGGSSRISGSSSKLGSESESVSIPDSGPFPSAGGAADDSPGREPGFPRPDGQSPSGAAEPRSSTENPCRPSGGRSLFGPTDHRWTLIPTRLGAPEEVVVADPTQPADQLANDHPQRCRIDRIEVSRVIEACERVLAASDTPGIGSP